MEAYMKKNTVLTSVERKLKITQNQKVSQRSWRVLLSIYNSSSDYPIIVTLAGAWSLQMYKTTPALQN